MEMSLCSLPTFPSCALPATSEVVALNNPAEALPIGGPRGGRFRARERGTSHAKAFRQWLVRTVGLCRLCQV